MVSPPTSRGAGARSYYKYVSESVNQTQIVDHCLCKQHIVCQPDPGMVIVLLMTLFPLLTSSYRIQTLRNSANFVPSGLMRVGGNVFSLDATDGGNFAHLGCQGTYDKWV